MTKKDILYRLRRGHFANGAIKSSKQTNIFALSYRHQLPPLFPGTLATTWNVQRLPALQRIHAAPLAKGPPCLHFRAFLSDKALCLLSDRNQKKWRPTKRRFFRLYDFSASIIHIAPNTIPLKRRASNYHNSPSFQARIKRLRIINLNSRIANILNDRLDSVILKRSRRQLFMFYWYERAVKFFDLTLRDVWLEFSKCFEATTFQFQQYFCRFNEC